MKRQLRDLDRFLPKPGQILPRRHAPSDSVRCRIHHQYTASGLVVPRPAGSSPIRAFSDISNNEGKLETASEAMESLQKVSDHVTTNVEMDVVEGEEFVAGGSHNHGIDDVWAQTTHRLLEQSPGSMTNSVWSEAHSTILFWLKSEDIQAIPQSLLLLDRLFEEEQYQQDANSDQHNPPEFFRTDLLNLVLNHWRKISEQNPAVRKFPENQPQAIVNRLMHYHAVGDSTKLRPDTQSFAMVIDGATSYLRQERRRGSHHDQALYAADNLMKWLVDEAPSQPHIRPNVVAFSSLMNCWVKSKDERAPERVEELLDEMLTLHEDHPDWGVCPNQFTYATSIDAWAKVGRVDRVEELLGEMYAQYKEGGIDVKPNLTAFNGYLVVLAKVGRMDKAWEVLQQMDNLYTEGELDNPPNVISYSTVLNAFAKSSLEGTAARAEAILRQMHDRGIEANEISWNTVIDAYAKERNVAKAEELLHEMNQEYLNGKKELQPTARTYSIVISCWARTRSPDAGERAEQLLSLMQEMARKGELEEVDTIVCNTVLDCWAKSGSKDAGLKSNEFLEKMILEGMKPDRYSFNTVISALVREGKLVEAEQILDRMISMGIRADPTSYNTLLHGWSKSSARNAHSQIQSLYKRMKTIDRLQPDLVTMNTLLNFFSRRGDVEAAENMLDEMCRPDSRVKPDSISFNTVISGWTNSQAADAPERAESVLSVMTKYGRNIRPNTITFNSLMNSWVNCNPLEAVDNCKRLVGTMHDMADAGNADVKPNSITYNTLLKALVKGRDEHASTEAIEILEEMRRRFKVGEHRLKPTVHTYGTVLNILTRDTTPEAGTRALDVLRQWVQHADQGQVDGRPRVFEFTCAVRAFRNSDRSKSVYGLDEILFLLLKEVENVNKAATPDSKFFTSVLQVLAGSTSKHTQKCAHGLVKLMKEYNIPPDSRKIEYLKKCMEDRENIASNTAA